MGLSRFLRRGHWDAERARELDAYLDIETQENIARGMAPDEARFAAQRKLGNATLVREEIYRMNTIGVIETIWQDLRYGVRLLRLSPGFALVAILSLALGIGANTAIFQLINAVRLRALPVPKPDEIAIVQIADLDGARGSFDTWYPAVTNPIWERIRAGQQAFSTVFAWSPAGFDLATSGPSRFTEHALWVSGDFFRGLGVGPALGRVFTEADDRRGCGTPGAVISYAFWQREFGGDPAAVGRMLSLDRRPIEIIGVTPAGFFGVDIGQSYDVALPICSEATFSAENSRLDAGTSWWITVMGRLKPGWSVERARAHLGSISPGLFEATLPKNYPAVSVKKYLAFKLTALGAESGLSGLRDDYSTSLLMLLAIAGLVLLIACANLANLMLARASARAREIAVRLAIGASRARVARQMVAESVLLAAIGATLGAILARALSQALVAFLSTPFNPVFLDLDPDWRVFGFTAGVAVICSLLFGLAPAVRATRVPTGTVLKSAGRGLTADRERQGVRRVLVVSQVALSLVLLVGALLFVGTFRNLLTVETGFRQDGIIVANLDLRRMKLPPERRAPVRRELVDLIGTIPGVEAAADTDIVPLEGASWSNVVWKDGSVPDRDAESRFSSIGRDYFRTLGTPLVAGRQFDDRDALTAPKVAIVNESFARKFLKGSDAIGQRFWVETTPNRPETRFEIVGVVKDTKYRRLREAFGPIAFLPSSQAPRTGQYVRMLIRSAASTDATISAIDRALSRDYPAITFNFSVLKTQIRESLLRERLMATLSGFFGALAMLLATIGLYGVMSYMVVRRKNEIGIRMALGAGRRDVMAMIMREAAVLVGLGLAIGAVIAIALAHTAAALLFGVRPGDPVSLLLGIASLAAVAALASYLPAQRAARLEPTIALRGE
jgi:putative ABC transport system permease protein